MLRLKNSGLKITAIEDDQDLQERLLSLFHATTVTFDVTNCMKFIENYLGKGSYVAPGEPLLSVMGMSKSFSGLQALDNVNLSLMPQERLAVVGENGAGKTTLMKILAGVFPADGGRIRIGGDFVDFRSVADALEHGIALIHQELNLVPNLDLGANIFLGREPRRLGFIDRQRIRREAVRHLKMVGLDISPGRLVSSLSIGQQQLVEIARAVATDARILIMDEPTSSLSQHEAQRLFDVIEDLSDRGVSIIYISHRLGEVQGVADRVEVLRDGRNAGGLEKEEISHDRMVRLMVGRDISQFYHRLERQLEAPLLKVEKLCTRAFPSRPLSFQIRGGEIVGVAGLVGAGRTALLQTLFGIQPPVSGRIEVSGRTLRPGRTLEAIRAGMALVPEDRKEQALVLDAAVRVNLTLARLRRDQKFGFLDLRREKELVGRMIEDLGVVSRSSEQPVKDLSGGNQQKVVLGKWLATNPSLLLLDEPTRGVDVGSKQEIYRLIEELAAKGVAVLFVSSEMEEVLGLSDRVIVMHEGGIAGKLARKDWSEKKIMEMATGMS